MASIENDNDNDDDWLAEDPVSEQTPQTTKPWRLLVVDDEPDIHAVTRLALGKVSFKGREIEVLSAYTGAQGYDMLAKEPDIALVLLDVVMETDDAGLRLARRIREELNNNLVRIVLRTGQPGQAPASGSPFAGAWWKRMAAGSGPKTARRAAPASPFNCPWSPDDGPRRAPVGGG